MSLLDKQRISHTFARATNTYNHQAKAQAQICKHLAEMPQQHGFQQFHRVLEIGCGNGGLTEQLQKHYPIDEWVLNDLNPKALAKDIVHGKSIFIVEDAETLDSSPKITPPFDLIASASTIQWFQQPEKWAYFAYKMLSPNGLLLFSTFLPGNLHEIQSLTGAGLSYPSSHHWENWLNPHFQILEIQTQAIILTFPHPLAVLKHLQQTGVNATQSFTWTKKRLAEFSQNYKTQFSVSDGVSLTYQPLLVLAQKK